MERAPRCLFMVSFSSYWFAFSFQNGSNVVSFYIRCRQWLLLLLTSAQSITWLSECTSECLIRNAPRIRPIFEQCRTKCLGSSQAHVCGRLALLRLIRGEFFVDYETFDMWMIPLDAASNDCGKCALIPTKPFLWHCSHVHVSHVTVGVSFFLQTLITKQRGFSGGTAICLTW